MSVRAAQWRSRPSQEFQELQEQLSHQNSTRAFYMLQRLGPASFIIGQATDDGHADAKFRVNLGNSPTCSCLLHGPSEAQEPCIHLLFVMLRIFRLAANNPLLWQSALTDRELQQILDGGLRCFGNVNSTASQSPQPQSLTASSSGAKVVDRRPVEENEPCPICYEALSAVSPDWLVWCSSSCGRSIHGRCMRIWSNHQTKTLKQVVTCPLCRCTWGACDWRPPPAPVTSSANKVNPARPHHRGVECAACHQNPLEGTRFRCLSCDSFDLCNRCFISGQHLHHKFVCRQTPAAEEVIAERPVQGVAGVLQCARCFSGGSTGSPRNTNKGCRTGSSSTSSTGGTEVCTPHNKQSGYVPDSPELPCLRGQQVMNRGSSSISSSKAHEGIKLISTNRLIPRHNHQQRQPDQHTRLAAVYPTQLLGQALVIGPAAGGDFRTAAALAGQTCAPSNKLAAKLRN